MSYESYRVDMVILTKDESTRGKIHDLVKILCEELTKLNAKLYVSYEDTSKGEFK